MGKLVFLLLPLVFWGEIRSDQINITSSKNLLRIEIPTQAEVREMQNLQNVILEINESYTGDKILKNLPYPFGSIEILPQENKTLLKLKTQASNIVFSSIQDKQGLHLTFEVQTLMQWWRYALVLALLVGLLAFLLYLKKRQKTNPSTRFKMAQYHLNKDSRVITLDNGKTIFTIFANEKGCTLLESKEKDSQEG